MKFLTLLLLASLLFSCEEQKEDEEKKPINPNSYNWNQPLRTIAMQTEEFNIANTVCRALRSKREFFETLGDREETFGFTPNVLNCGDRAPRALPQVASYLRIVRGNPLRFEAVNRAQSVIEDILTDEHERIETVCADVFRGVVPNRIVAKGSFRYQISFFKDNKRNEYIQIAEFRQNGQKFMPYLIDIALILTPNTVANSDHHGIAKVRTKNRKCSTNDSRFFQQIWN